MDPGIPTGDVVFDALWGRVMAAWDDERVHHAVLEYAMQKELLADLAGHYRALAEDPEKGAAAKRKLDAVVVAATQILYSMKTPPSQKIPTAITLTAAAICVFIVGWVALLVLGR